MPKKCKSPNFDLLLFGPKYIQIMFKCHEIPLWDGKKRFIKFRKVLKKFQVIVINMSSEGAQGGGGGNGDLVELMPGVSDLLEHYSQTLQCCD